MQPLNAVAAGTTATIVTEAAADPVRATLLQGLAIDCASDRRALYWRAEPLDAARPWSDVTLTDGGVELGSATRLSFDTYLNSFFEAQWHRLTGLQSVLLQVEVKGTGSLQVYRRALEQRTLVHEQAVGPGVTTVCIPIKTVNFRQQGVLSAELVSHGERLRVAGGGWFSETLAQARVGLAAVICTFHREAALARMLATLDSDAATLDRLTRIIIVNQGHPGLARRLDAAGLSGSVHGKLRMIEQGNFGGAGGFTRGLLAALDDEAVSHVVLLDDDIELEPSSLFRIASLFAYAKQDAVIGGQMLDMLQPTQMYEAGAVVSDRHWAFQPRHHTADIADPDSLEPLSRPDPVHYNGWWCCAFPLAVVRRLCLPLPCFIRGDDLEYGMRLYNQGVPAVSMPGVAVWHEPFYLKWGGWHLYYETRNMLVTAALHMPVDRWPTVRRIGRLTVLHLLTFRYYGTALILTGIRDYLAGPGVLDGDPLVRHRQLQQLKLQYPVHTAPRSTVLQPQRLKRRPPNNAACFALLGYLALRNAVARDPATEPRVLAAAQLDWLNMRGIDNLAVETWWDEEMPVYTRSRASHRVLLVEAVRLLLRLFREGPARRLEWRAAFGRLTADHAWRSYLGMPDRKPDAGTEKRQAA